MDRSIRNDKILVVKNGVISDGSLRVIKLLHPKTGEEVCHLYNEEAGLLVELNAFSESKNRSWFVGDSVVSDGRLFIATPYDPLFLLLPLLIKSRDKFRPLDHMLTSELSCRELFPIFLHEKIKDQLEEICTSKEIGDSTKYYQYSEEKVVSWLRRKVMKVAEVLKMKNIYVGQGSQVKACSFGKQSFTEEDYISYSFGIINDYIPADIAEVLKNDLGIADVQPQKPITDMSNPKKKIKLEPENDYSKYFTPINQSKGKPLTSRQKALSKSSLGSRSIQSFFKSSS